MRFEVPQFIEIEDKIFGPLTWRQFLYLGGGVGIAISLFFMANIVIFVVFGLPIAILAGALSFYPVNNRPFSFFLESAINYFTGPKLYLWRRKEDVVYDRPETSKGAPMPQQPLVRPSGKNISSLARKLELQAIQKDQ